MKRLLLVSLACLASPFVAGADVPPPPGYVETCTVAKQCGANEVGATCGTFFREPDKCKQRYSGTAFTYKCRAGGASTWTEVWCAPKGTPDPGSLRPAPTPPPEPPPPPPG